jgi:hypothetical protein
VLEQAIRIQSNQVEDGKEDVMSTKNDHTVSQETLTDHNLVFKEQLAQLQDDNMKQTIALQLEQYVKKELVQDCKIVTMCMCWGRGTSGRGKGEERRLR